MVEALFWVSTLELISVFVALITFGGNPLKNNLTNTLCVHLVLYNTQSTSWKSVKVATEDYSCYYLFEFFLERSNSDFLFCVSFHYYCKCYFCLNCLYDAKICKNLTTVERFSSCNIQGEFIAIIAKLRYFCLFLA